MWLLPAVGLCCCLSIQALVQIWWSVVWCMAQGAWGLYTGAREGRGDDTWSSLRDIKDGSFIDSQSIQTSRPNLGLEDHIFTLVLVPRLKAWLGWKGGMIRSVSLWHMSHPKAALAILLHTLCYNRHNAPVTMLPCYHNAAIPALSSHQCLSNAAVTMLKSHYNATITMQYVVITTLMSPCCCTHNDIITRLPFQWFCCNATRNIIPHIQWCQWPCHHQKPVLHPAISRMPSQCWFHISMILSQGYHPKAAIAMLLFCCCLWHPVVIFERIACNCQGYFTHPSKLPIAVACCLHPLLLPLLLHCHYCHHLQSSQAKRMVRKHSLLINLHSISTNVWRWWQKHVDGRVGMGVWG